MRPGQAGPAEELEDIDAWVGFREPFWRNVRRVLIVDQTETAAHCGERSRLNGNVVDIGDVVDQRGLAMGSDSIVAPPLPSLGKSCGHGQVRTTDCFHCRAPCGHEGDAAVSRICIIPPLYACILYMHIGEG